MPFPAFATDKSRVLFFSRGRGRGHAIPDIEIIQALERIRPDIEVRIVSYDVGAATFAARGFRVIDLCMPPISPIAEISMLAGKLIGSLQPDVVVAHEEFAAMPAAKIFDKRTIFITDWFTEPEFYSMGALKFADEILFTGREGVFEEPPWVRGRVRYIGPVLRSFEYTRRDSRRARQELGIEEEEFVIAVLPGSWREAECPSFDLITAAFDAHPAGRKRLIWLAGADAPSIREKISGRNSLVFDEYWKIDQLMAAADAAITKMNRLTITELYYHGTPAVALTWGLNPTDDRIVATFDGVVQLDARRATAGMLQDALVECHAKANTEATGKADTLFNASRCAEAIAKAAEQSEPGFRKAST